MTTNGTTPGGMVEERFDHVVRLRFDNPARRNPLSFALVEDLVERFARLDADPEVRAVILTGTGPAFCVGGDQADFAKALGKPMSELLESYPPVELFRLARSLRTPLIAAVNGTAMGGGMGLTCMAHFAIAADHATFGIPEIKLGIFPLTILPLVRPVLGDRRTMELALTGRSLDAAEALAVGVVQRVVPGTELQDEALAVAKRIASFSPLAVRLGITAFNESTDMPFDNALDHLNMVRAVAFASEDLNEGSTAFLEKRDPVWKGR
ncbi:enoyl-CoA hydratase/isomerase family protein [Pseudonocardia halophobica]|uniref:enoyl-CoA hydratase/isomerase family protein n=1 Tax=Pseudonocardia halophobica TaxID=29401 RepID=UPI003D8FE709